jgi:hypothetical protein
VDQREFDLVWRRISELAGQVFRTKTNREFTYGIAGDALTTDRTNRCLPRGDFEKAHRLMPLSGPGQINSLVQGPAYVWAILDDERVKSASLTGLQARESMAVALVRHGHAEESGRRSRPMARAPESAGLGANGEAFLRDQRTYFADSFEQFLAFGGPCVHFHRECVLAGEAGFLSERHVEMLYATLTAWGMHRLGDAGTTKTKLTEWTIFRDSVRRAGELLDDVKPMTLLSASEREYADAIARLKPAYAALRISKSDATIVANSKALFHLLPELVPPVDRQYTVRFFGQKAGDWRDSKGKFRVIMLPAGLEAQFDLFRDVCTSIKKLADGVDRSLFDAERRDHEVTPPKAIDNAIVNFVRINSAGVASA